MSDDSIAINPGSIAIVGIAGRFPSARTPAQLWDMMAGGKEAAQWLGDDELRSVGVSDDDLRDPNYVRASLVLPDMEMFDADFFGFSKRDASVLDPQHRHFLECSWEALEDAGHMPEKFDGAIGVFGGCGMQAYLPYNLLSNPELVKSMGLFLLRHTGNDKDFLCSRVSYLLNLKGPSMSVQTACSTSLVAVHVASQSLLSGECDMALAGGVSIELPHRQGYRYAEGEIMSPDGHCRAFDDGAAGTIFGSGAAVVVLRRLEDAVRDGDNIYAVIRGSAVNNDGSGKAGYFAPSVDGQARAAVEALAVAGVEPASVSYIEAHGTGTPVGDPIEVAALSQAYGSGGKGFCGIGSVKTNIGHLDTAAGAAALIKVALAMRHEAIPATLNFTRPNSRMDIANTPFRVVDRLQPWRKSGAPRRAAVNSLGVGGTNAHVIVEEAPAHAAREDVHTPQVFTLSARSAASLAGLKTKWVDFLATPPPGFNLADAAYTLQEGRRDFVHRCTVVARDAVGLRNALEAKTHPRSVTAQAGTAAPGVVFMFPGGGAHYPGAGRELLTQPAFREAVDECFRLMPAEAPAELRDIMFAHGPSVEEAARTLEQPRYAIPALFVLEYALAKLWQAWGVQPCAVIGHSAGEYAAACIAGVMSLPDALAVVVLRGQIFEAAPPGGMVSVDLPEDQLRAAMQGLPLDIAAINAPDLCIASGANEALAQLEQRLAARGLEARRLRIAVAAHSRLLDGVLERFRERLSRITFHAPTVPFISNLTGGWADGALLTDPGYWVRHLREPVRFAQGLTALKDLPDAVLVEAGPGQGLGALARQNAPGSRRMVLPCTCKAQEPNDDLALMLAAAGGVWAAGNPVDWGAVRGPGHRYRISLPTYAFDHQRHWIEPGARVLPQAKPEPKAEVARRPALQRLPEIADWFRVPQWMPAPALAARGDTSGHWLVFGGSKPACTDLVEQVQEGGGTVTLVRHDDDFARQPGGSFSIEPGNAEHYSRLLQVLEQEGSLPSRIVHLWALDTRAGKGQVLAFDSLVCLAKAMQALDLDTFTRLVAVTAGSQSPQGETVLHAERAMALGPVRVIPAELPQVHARLVDFAQGDLVTAAHAIVQEALDDGDSDLVAYREGARLAPQLAAAPTAKAPGRWLRDNGVYLITGGLGDIALDLANYLARTRKARVALVSRRTLPPKANWRGLAASGDHSAPVRIVRRLLALEEHGAQVIVLAADVTDRRAMTRVIGETRSRFGAIHGVFHAAGVIDDAPIATKSDESMQLVLDAKAGGAQLLHELLPPGELDVFALFSSTSSLLGAPGQVDYTAANAFLESLAASRADGLSIRWGIWGDRGMAARAYGAHALAHDADASHPLLGVQVDSENGAAFEATYDTQRLWVLREHKVAGRPVLPGTAYIEIARAAMAAMHPQCAIELRSLSFEEAMVFEAGTSRIVRTELRRNAGGYDFTVRSRGLRDDQWLEHAHASASVFLGGAVGQPAPRVRDWQPGAIPQDKVVEFGERWRNIMRMQIEERTATAEFELPQAFASDLATYGAHPAMTDMAATFGLHMVDAAQRAQNLFVPLSIDRIRLFGALPQRITSRVKLGDTQDRLASFDVSLHGPAGETLATLEGFSLRGVSPAALAHPTPGPAPSLVDEMLACGIRGEDAPALFDRIFSSSARDIVVSSIDVNRLREALRDSRPKPVPRKARPVAAQTAALNPVETVLAEAWRELLGIDEVAPQDDFFALGGHSLAAVRLFARIRKHFNVDLPLATLFQAPTLGALAALVAQHAGLATDPVQAPSKKSNVIPLGPRGWSPLVAICREGDRPPLFCVHGAGGNVLNFKVISDKLGPQQPFYGLQAQGVDGRLQPLDSIEAMAAQYVEAIRTVDPHGPYQLAGYSAGGVIALEMAHQLRRDGAQVSLLAMIDTLSPAAARRKVSPLRKILLMRHWSLDFLLAWPGRRRKGKQADAQYAHALQRLARGEPLPPELVEHHLFYNFVDAQSRYLPQAYDGDMVLFRASEADTQYLGAGDALGWEEHVQGEIQVAEIAGSHFTMMAEPGVSQLIGGLRQALGLEPPRPGPGASRTLAGVSTVKISRSRRA